MDAYTGWAAGRGCLTKICVPIILTVDFNKTRIYRMLERCNGALHGGGMPG
ncbi:hypothetical protein NKDENANG_00448 [Candidatus Entotheonellaceae bacterium PAL068K]